MRSITLVHLYPDLLRTYGDRGNVMALAHRARARDIPVDVIEVSRGARLPARCDLVFMGGGSDRIQTAIGSDLLSRRSQLHDAAVSGTIILGVCGGYQLLGTGYRLESGEVVEGLGLLDATTHAGRDRIVGRTAVTAGIGDLRSTLIGFENHAGRTWLGPGAIPLARARRRAGNNGVDRTEGAVQGGVFGTYLHGPVLALNPAFADLLLARATRMDLAPLNDVEERAVRRAWSGVGRRIR